MQYAVMDLEFNQPFDFEKGEKAAPNEKLPFEIIQIGIVKMDNSFNITDKLNLFVKPQLYTRIHPYVERITGLKTEMFEGQKTFPLVYDEFLSLASGEDVVLCVWGGSDVKLLYKNISFYGLCADNLTKNFINVQSLTSKFLKLSTGNHIGLKNAAELLCLPTETSFHDALNDALYTAEILKVIKTDNMAFETFNLADLNKSKQEDKYNFNIKALLSECEKMYGRKLTKKEKSIVRKIYIMGQNKKFDKAIK